MPPTDKSEPLSAHDHGNCELCDQIERELAEARSELLAIHEAIMNPQSVVINGSDTFTVAHVKAFIQRAPSAVSPSIPAGWTLQRWPDPYIVVMHEEHGTYAASPSPDNIASYMLHHLADALLKAAPQPPVTPHRSMPGLGESPDSSNGDTSRQPCETGSGDTAAAAAPLSSERAPKEIIDPPGAAVEMFRKRYGRLPNRVGDQIDLADRLELAAQACRAAHLLSCEATCREAVAALSASGALELLKEARQYLDIIGKPTMVVTQCDAEALSKRIDAFIGDQS